jgi:hypothetical protein
MKKEEKENIKMLLQNSPIIRFTKNGILIFDGSKFGGFGYLLNNGKIIKIPINIVTLTSL